MTRAVPNAFSNVTTAQTPNLDADFSALTPGSVLPCTATGTNAIALTPVSNTLTVSAYTDKELYSFNAANDSTGSVTVAISGNSALNLYLPGGTVQAGSGNIVSGAFYIIAFQSSLNSGSGGFVITNQSTTISQVPQGRLTLVSGTPVMTADETAKSVIYYTPYQGNQIPIYNGAAFTTKTFPEISATLDTTNALSGSLYDLFVYNDSGTIRIGYGPAWTSSSGRGTGAGTTEIQMLQGIWTNKNAITLRYDSTHTTTVSANQATYVGTFYATANGQTGMAFKPAAAAGGANCFLAMYNAYNRVTVCSLSRDSTASWTYNSATWRAANNSTSNRISYVDGLGQSAIRASYLVTGQSSGANSTQAGIDFNSSTATPAQASTANVSTGASQFVLDEFAPALGFNFVQAVESVTTGTGTFATSTGLAQGLILHAEM